MLGCASKYHYLQTCIIRPTISTYKLKRRKNREKKNKQTRGREGERKGDRQMDKQTERNMERKCVWSGSEAIKRIIRTGNKNILL
jgi:hypothetical protein